MRKGHVLAAAAVAVMLSAASCRRDAGPQLSWHEMKIERDDAFVKVDLSYPLAEGGRLADSINAKIAGLLKADICSDCPEDCACTPEQSVDSMMARKKSDPAMDRIPYEFNSSGSIYLRRGISSVDLETYSFTGGAHGQTVGYICNFDNSTGAELSVGEMFTDTVRLSQMNREAFKAYLKAKDIPDVESYLFVDVDELSLPQNIGFDEQGVVMLYNQYEIAAYVFGQSRYVLPYTSVDSILTRIVKK